MRKKDEKEMKNDEFTLSTWIQKLEQSIKSIEKRLDAVERRLSKEPFKGTVFQYSSSVKEKENIPDDLMKKIEKRLNIIEKRMEEFEKKEPVTISLKRNSSKNNDFSVKMTNIEKRLNRLERRDTTLKLRGIEFSIEITGIVGGLFTILIALLLLSGNRAVVMSPYFIFIIGFILLLSVAVKTCLLNKNAGKNGGQ
ncbi:MAG: hypothetical protein J7K61_05715 [Thermoplasmata archaeon]|nr:hypothetical protein [Thermoplasmata archaeon]